VIAPHPDDETLGCGGLIALALDAGRDVLAIVVTDGGASHPLSNEFRRQDLAALRAQELQSGLMILGLDPRRVFALAIDDGSLDRLGDDTLSLRLDGVLAGQGVKTLFSTSADDPHPDHRAVYRAAELSALRSGAALWSYPVRAHVIAEHLKDPASLVRLPIDSALDRKRSAINCHQSQLGGSIDAGLVGFSLTDEDLRLHTQNDELFRRCI